MKDNLNIDFVGDVLGPSTARADSYGSAIGTLQSCYDMLNETDKSEKSMSTGYVEVEPDEFKGAQISLPNNDNVSIQRMFKKVNGDHTIDLCIQVEGDRWCQFNECYIAGMENV